MIAPSKTWTVLICVFLSTACGQEPSGQEQTSEVSSFGSWSTMVGGSLATLSDSQAASIETMDFYRVFTPVGLGVVHEFIGIVAKTRDGKTWALTTGLVGDADDAYFRANIRNSDLALYLGTSGSAAVSQRLINQINSDMARSPYHNQAYYVSAMTMTPLFGRPCAKVAKKLARLIQSAI